MIYVDTCIYLNLIRKKEEQKFFKASYDVLKNIHEGLMDALTSVLTFHELKWALHKKGETLKAEQAISLIESLQNHDAVPLTLGMVRLGTDLQIAYNLKSHDAFHLATAITTKCNVFITRDSSLQKIRDILVVSPEDFLKSIK